MDFVREPLKTGRRTFLKIAAAAYAAPRVMPASALGANDRIIFGVAGVGGQGTGHVNGLVGRSEQDNVRVAAIADVYQRRVTRAKDISKGDGYLDYRKLLERNDIDAVLIATSDHWHAKIALVDCIIARPIVMMANTAGNYRPPARSNAFIFSTVLL